MEMTLQVPFEQLLTLIKSLTPAQKETIRKELSENEPQQKKNDEFIEFLLNGPVYSDGEIAVIEENKKSIAAWRTNDYMVDSTLLIDYFRKTDKANARLLSHFKTYDHLYISSVTEFEVVNGATKIHLQFWDRMLTRFTILNFDSRAARQAADIVAKLKIKRKSINKPDLFIAATAIVHGVTLDTLNTKHFTDIDGLNLLIK